MARKADELEESVILDGDSVLLRAVEDQMPSVAVKVVYLGTHPNKGFRLDGTVSITELQDEGGKPELLVSCGPAGATYYDFSRYDTNGQLLKSQMHEGHRFNVVRHPDHVLKMLQMKGEDDEPQFRVIGSRVDVDAIRRYAASKVRKRTPEEGLAVLEAMGLGASR